MKFSETYEKRGRLFVISGPSGVGKSSLINDVLNDLGEFVRSVSVTTRPKRENEVCGKQYKYVSEEDFRTLIEKDLLLEWATYSGHLYGTPKEFVINQLNLGKNVILEIEVNGAMQVKKKIKDTYLIFITVSSLKQLEDRLIKRGMNDINEIRKRMKIAKDELKFEKYYDCVIVNNNYNEALCNLKYTLDSEKRKV